MVDALGQRADEGRDKQRYATVRSTYSLIRGFPNGGTRYELCHITLLWGKPVN